MQEIIDNLIGLTLLAFTLERGVEYLFSMQPFFMFNAKFPSWKLKTLAAFFMGFGISYFAKLDIIGIFLSRPELNGITGYLFTGLLLAGGSNIFADIMTMVQNLRNYKSCPTITPTVATKIENIPSTN
jgi:hypothetical protein